MEDPCIVSRAWTTEYIEVVVSHTWIMLLTFLSMFYENVLQEASKSYFLPYFV